MAKVAGRKSQYTVDSINLHSQIVEAESPIQAIKKVLGKYAKDYTIKKTNYCPNTKVCLLGGTRESVSFYNVTRTAVKGRARVQIFVNKGGQIASMSLDEAIMRLEANIESDKLKPGKLDLTMHNIDITGKKGKMFSYVLSGYGYITVKDIPCDKQNEVETFVSNYLTEFDVGDFEVSDWKIVDWGVD